MLVGTGLQIGIFLSLFLLKIVFYMEVNPEKSWPLAHIDDVNSYSFWEWFCNRVAFAFFSVLTSTHAFRLTILTIYQIYPYLSKPKLSFHKNLFYLSMNVLTWHAPIVSSTSVRDRKEDSDLDSFYSDRGMVRRNLINLILPREKVCHGNMSTKVCFWK